MPNVAKVLKEEIARISRKVAKAAVTSIRKPTVRLRKDVADLKRRLAVLEKANKELQASLAKVEAAQPATPPEQTSRAWISGKGIKTLRKRLGLSQADFARLLGVSMQIVQVWEKKPGMLTLRKDTKAAVFAVRGIGAREAKKRLEEMKAKQKVKRPREAKKPMSKRGKKAASKPSHRGKAKRR
jgi:DNA-binding transcriptional regulator YiaG